MEGSNGQNNRRFKYLIPHLFFRYNLSRDTQLFAEYNSSVREPAIDIMQPISYSTDQFNQFTGNSNLEPEHRHKASLRFRTYSQFSFNSFSASVGIARTNANIIRSASIDSLLVRNTSWVNSDRETVSYANTNFSAPLRLVGTKINISVNANRINRYVLINQEQDRVNWRNYQLDLSLENWKKNNLDIMTRFRLTKNVSSYQTNNSLNNTFLRKSFYTDITLYLKRWEIYSSMNYVIFGQAEEQSPDQIPLWTASVSKTFLQNEKARISLAVFDALDVNKNFNQTTQLNYIQSEQTNALGRYFMLSFSYKLFKVN